MLWFKHDSDAGNDAKLRKLRHKYGAQGYGIYWYCLELIARNVNKNNLTFELEHDAELIADDFKLSSELVQEMMIYMVNLGLFENVDGVITCLKMSTRTDEYTQKLITKNKNSPDNVGTQSGQLPRISELKEEKREEEKREEENITARQKLIYDSCNALKAAGVLDFSSISPSFTTLIDQGVTPEEFFDVANSVSVKKFNYVLKAIAGKREDASKISLKEKEDKKSIPDWYQKAMEEQAAFEAKKRGAA